MLKTVYGESTMSRSHVFKWHKHFREGREDVNDDERLAAPVVNTSKCENQGTYAICQVTCRMIAKLQSAPSQKIVHFIGSPCSLLLTSFLLDILLDTEDGSSTFL
jgi:hypothetical protein